MIYQEEADKVAQIQREAGWSEYSIYLYAKEQKLCVVMRMEICSKEYFS